MLRDMELVRKILLEIEVYDAPRGGVPLDFPDFNPEVVSYHIKLLDEAGLITAFDASTRASLEWIPTSLTWAGHEFLDAARNDTIWNKVTTSIRQKAASVPFEVLKAAIIQHCKAIVGVA